MGTRNVDDNSWVLVLKNFRYNRYHCSDKLKKGRGSSPELPDLPELIQRPTWGGWLCGRDRNLHRLEKDHERDEKTKPTAIRS